MFFCVARENLRPRHAVKFSMPCAWRGVKDFLLLAMRYERFNGTQIAQIRQIFAASLGIAQASLVLRSLLCILTFHHRNAASLGIVQVNLALRSFLCIDVPSSKELTLGLPQINLGILSLNRSFAF